MFMPQLIRNFLYSWHCSVLLITVCFCCCHFPLLLLLPGVLCDVHAAAHPQLPVQLAPQRLPGHRRDHGAGLQRAALQQHLQQALLLDQ
jgi:hypothetical protein